jgi:uncharacterized protein (TIGR01777 family)
MRVFIAGGSGLIGTRLISLLHQRGDRPVLLTRSGAGARQKFGPQAEIVEGDPTKPGPWMDAVQGCDAVVNLTGENIFARRWNDDFKKTLRDSRLLSTRNVVEALRRNPRTTDGQGKVLVNASAIGYYGSRGDEELTEDSAPGDDFLARLCVEWEQAAREAEGLGVRTCMARVGVVMDKHGGALAQLLPPFKMFVGGPAGSGKQWMSWIHRRDLCNLILHALDHEGVTGPLNGTAPEPVRSKEFARTLGRVLGRPAFLPTPPLALRAALGEVARILTDSQRCSADKALKSGFQFQFPTLEAALHQLLGK